MYLHCDAAGGLGVVCYVVCASASYIQNTFNGRVRSRPVEQEIDSVIFFCGGCVFLWVSGVCIGHACHGRSRYYLAACVRTRNVVLGISTNSIVLYMYI